MTATATDSDVEILNKLFDEESLPCAYNDCQEVATHLLVCDCTVGREPICEEHAIALAAPGILDAVIFDRTCKHVTPVFACTIQPI